MAEIEQLVREFEQKRFATSATAEDIDVLWEESGECVDRTINEEAYRGMMRVASYGEL
jgi:hypothetical protein